MRKLVISIVLFTSAIMLSSCACNSGCGGSSAFDMYTYTAPSNCCGASAGCCGSGGW